MLWYLLRVFIPKREKLVEKHLICSGLGSFRSCKFSELTGSRWSQFMTHVVVKHDLGQSIHTLEMALMTLWSSNLVYTELKGIATQITVCFISVIKRSGIICH